MMATETSTTTENRRTPAAKPSRLRTVAVLVLLLGTLSVALAVRLVRLAEVHYWFDETFSLRMAEFPIAEMVARCARDTHPPLFFLGLKGWVSVFGDGEREARLFSTLWSLLAVGCAFGFTYEAVSSAAATTARALFAATVAGLCLALSPLQISWAQQVRMYAPLACLAILSTWLLWRAVRKTDSPGRWLAFAVVELMGLYTHVTMLLVFAGHLLALLAIVVQRRRDAAATRKLLCCCFPVMFAVGLLAAPWALVVRAQHARVQEDFWIESFDLDLLGQAFVKCFTVYQGPGPEPGVGLWIAQGMVLVLVLVAAGKRPADLLISVTAAAPFLLLIAASLIDVNIVNGRYFISGHALACVAVGVALARLPSWLLRIPTAVVLFGVLGMFVRDQHAWRAEAAGHDGLPALLATWREHRADGEPLVFSNPMFYTTARIYQGEAGDLKIFRSEESYYPFFVGTAITSPDEFLSGEAIDAGPWQTVWVCDYGQHKRFLQPVELDESWQLVAETLVKDYSGTFYLRRYDRTAGGRPGE